MIRVADYVMKCLAHENIRHLFYIPGGQCVYLTDALRRSEEIQGVAMHHEQAAAMAALTYSLYNENIGACLVTTGCAGTNTMTGLLHAWQDSIPCIFISGQQNYSQTIKASGLPLRQVGVQEADIETLVTPITKYAVTIENAEQVAFCLDKAIYMAREGRPGPVWLDIPLDVQNAMINENNMERYQIEQSHKLCASEAEIDYVVNALRESDRPMILAGHGIRTAHAIDELKKLLDLYQIPVAFSRFSSDMVSNMENLHMGVVSGIAGASRYGNFAIQNSDLIISIGCRLSIDTTGSERESFAREAKIIVVDIDEVEHSKCGVKIEKFIHSDAKEFMKMLLQREKEIVVNSDWLKTCRHWKTLFKENYSDKQDTIDLKYFMNKLSKALPDRAVVISDAGLTGAAVPAATEMKENTRILHSFAQGEMGYSLPAACGVAVLTENPVIAYTGDGSFMMNLQELQTVVRNQYNIKIVIMNNNGYSGVRHGQKAHFRGKTIGTDPSNGLDFPDYGKIASAFGIPYCKIENKDQINETNKKMLSFNGPYICEVMCDPEQFDLHNALVTYGKRKFGFRPIEDQSPFIDRKIFFEEMIVEPMETSYGKPV